jgi:hypothetical protein
MSTAFQRADGCSGSAIKGVKLLINNTSNSTSLIPIPPYTTESSVNEVKINVNDVIDIVSNSVNKISNLTILSVGYDQRLSFWKPKVSTLLALSKEYKIVTIQLDYSSNKSEEKIDQNMNNSFSKINLEDCDDSAGFNLAGQNFDHKSDGIHDSCLDNIDNIKAIVDTRNHKFVGRYDDSFDDDDSLLDDDDDDSSVGFNEVSVPIDDLLRSRDDLLQWVGGIPTHVGDVCALDAIVTSSSHNCDNIHGQGRSRSDNYEGNDYNIGITGDKDSAGGDKNEVMSRIEIDVVVAGEGFQIFNAVIY